MSIKPRKIRDRWQARYRDAGGVIRSAGMHPTLKDAQTATTLAEARVIEPPRVRTVSGAPKLKGEKPTLAEYAPKALAIMATKLQPGTMLNHERNLRLHLLPVFGDMRLKDIGPADVDEWWAETPESGARKAAYFTLSAVMRRARKHGLIKFNPCQTEGASKDVSKARPELPEEDVWRIIDRLGEDLRVFMIVMYGGSLRIGEALGLDRGHLNVETGAIRVEQQSAYFPPTASQPGGTRIKHRTKTGKNRTTNLPDWALDEVRDYLQRHPAKLAHAPLFVNARGQRLTRASVYGALHRAREEAGVEWAHAHDLRHTSLTLKMLMSGDLFAVMESAGHDDIRSAKRYQHVGSDRQSNLAKLWVRRLG